jgi:hypothetical protein
MIRQSEPELSESDLHPVNTYYPDTANYMRFWRDGKWVLDNPTEEELKELEES